MSLWDCNCALPALAACHWRGMVCSRLSLFSLLFCAWAWWCLRLGLAFRMVVTPQSGLLAQVSSLTLCWGHSGHILTLSNAACTSLPSPHLLVVGAGICAASPLGELPLGSLSVGFNYLFIFPPCYVALCFQGSPQTQQWECFLVFGNLSLFKTPFPGQSSLPTSFVSFFCLLYFFLPVLEDNDLLFWVPDVLCQHSEVVLWSLLSVEMFFWGICEGESGLPVLFLHHLRTALPTDSF